MKKICTLLLSLSLLTLPVLATYADVPATHWASGVIQTATDSGWMTGDSETTFDPQGTASRATVATVLYRMAYRPALSAKPLPYTDVDNTAWYADGVRWANQEGIVQGVGDNLFAPDTPVTREQLATMLYRYAQCMGRDTTATTDLSLYADADQVDPWALEALSWANASGIITGTEEGLLAPAASATRAELATVLTRFAG